MIPPVSYTLLMDWLEVNEPDLYKLALIGETTHALNVLNYTAGTSVKPDDSLEDACRTWLLALTSMKATPSKMTKQPQIPPECHNPRPIIAEDAMAAVRAMCS